jgi:hypothetical protein
MASKENTVMTINTHFGVSQRFMSDVDSALVLLYHEQVLSVYHPNANNTAYSHTAQKAYCQLELKAKLHFVSYSEGLTHCLCKLYCYKPIPIAHSRFSFVHFHETGCTVNTSNWYLSFC